MRPFIAVIVNLLILAVALATGIFLFAWVAIVFAAVVLFLIIRQKITGRPFMRVYTFREDVAPKSDQAGVIEAQYREIPPPG